METGRCEFESTLTARSTVFVGNDNNNNRYKYFCHASSKRQIRVINIFAMQKKQHDDAKQYRFRRSRLIAIGPFLP